MGLDWSIRYRNSKTNDVLPLMSFCGWNSKDILACLKHFCDKTDEDYTHTVVNVNDFMDWLKTADRIDKIFGNMHPRRIEESTYGSDASEAYADLCYDLGISVDDFVIYTLWRLADLGRFLREGDLLRDLKDDWYLEIEESF